MEDTTNNSNSISVVLKPSYISSIENASKQFRLFWKSLFLVAVTNTIVGHILQIPTYLGLFKLETSSTTINGWNFLYQFIIMLISLTLSYGYALATLKAARGEKPLIIDLFRPFKKFVTVVFSFILLSLIIVFSFLLLIIPGVFFSCRLAFVPYLVIDQNKGVFGAVGGSWKISKGHFWKIFLLSLTVVVIMVALLLIYILVPSLSGGGNIFSGNVSSMWVYQLIFAVIYLPTGIFIFLIIGSLYHAITHNITIEKEASNLNVNV